MSKFKDLYLSEAEDHLESLNKNLLALEKKPADKNILNELMRSSHTVKGSSAAMGFVKTAFLMHVLEDFFDNAISGQLAIGKDLINKLFSVIDSLELSLKSIKENDKELDTDDIANDLKKITGVATVGFGKSLKSTPSAQEQEVTIAPIEYIKVPVRRLDDLMNLAEELLIDKMRLEKESPEEMAPLVKHVSQLISDIQYQIMQSRLVAVSQVFDRFPRMIRDLSQKLDKEIEFEITGGDIELDRTIIDQLGTPLVHLLRNAADHGIKKSGKISLRATRDKNFAVIEVVDDGDGINWDKVIEVAAKRGYISADQTKKITQEEKISLIFRPQMSTNDQVTETSGRGVGLNVVKNFCESVRGTVELVSPVTDKGGTAFRLKLPSSLAIINSLIIKVSDQIMAIPFDNIIRTVKIIPNNIKTMINQDVAIIDETDIPLIWGHQFLKLSQKPEKDEYIVVIIAVGDQQAGLVIDELISEQEIIVKPLAPVLKNIHAFSGSTILGNGQTVLIIDTNSFIGHTKKHD